MKIQKKRWKNFWKDLINAIIILTCLFLCSLVISRGTWAQEDQSHWTEKVGQGWIDWTTYSISASVNGTSLETDKDSSLFLIKSRKLEVMNRVFNTFYHLPLENRDILGKIFTQATKKLLWGEINNCPNFSFVNTSENSTTITLTMPISTDFLQKAIPLALYLKIQNTHPISAWVGNSTTNDFVKGFTGLIIQVSTPDFSPSLFIYLYGENGDLLYGPASISYNNFIHKHMALFLVEEDSEIISKRVGARPLVLSAKDIFKNNAHALILDKNNSFYFKFRGITSFLTQGKVVIMKKPKLSINTGVQEFNLNN